MHVCDVSSIVALLTAHHFSSILPCVFKFAYIFSVETNLIKEVDIGEDGSPL